MGIQRSVWHAHCIARCPIRTCGTSSIISISSSSSSSDGIVSSLRHASHCSLLKTPSLTAARASHIQTLFSLASSSSGQTRRLVSRDASKLKIRHCDVVVTTSITHRTLYLRPWNRWRWWRHWWRWRWRWRQVKIMMTSVPVSHSRPATHRPLQSTPSIFAPFASGMPSRLVLTDANNLLLTYLEGRRVKSIQRFLSFSILLSIL